ncbi:MAG TPA: reactive intermediate/imine deaminase [Anaerolineae bacterium]|nr:reactive intermediate/imine deaminase [Anaerolineae bacterium]HCM97345.1 reactive intermediate/imine deaminase [Anaerolineae bacterium]
MKIIEIISDEVAYPPKFGSPTSLALQYGNLIFISGMMPWNLERNVVVPGDIEIQTRQALANMDAVLKAAGSSMNNILKITFYLTDIRNKQVVWKVRKEFFGENRPASTLVGVSGLVDPLALLEVDAIACKE